MKRILVPTDFSDTADVAVQYAGKLAQKTGARLYLIHILDVLGINEEDEEGRWATDLQEEGSGWTLFKAMLVRKTKERMMDTISRNVPEGVDVYDNIALGNTAPLIADAIEEYDPELVVMGTHGITGNSRFAGSNAQKVVRKSKVPVLTLKQPIQGDIKSIAFASDFSDEACEALPLVEAYADIIGAEISLVKVITPSLFSSTKESKEELREFLSKNKKDYPYRFYNSDRTEKGIIEFAAEENMDMIALATHGRSGFNQFFDQSVAEGIVNHAPRPVLTINIGDGHGEKPRAKDLEGLGMR